MRRQQFNDLLKKYDKIQGFIETLQGRTDGSQLLKEFHEFVIPEFCPKSYQMILLDETAHYLKVLDAHPPMASETLSQFNSASHIYHYFRKTGENFLLKTALSSKRESPLGLANARQQMRELNAECCFAFRFQKVCFGFIIFGAKMNGESYRNADYQSMGMLARKFSMTLNQIRLMNKVIQTHEQELIGRMSRGMAHDLNNLLTPISTYLQLVAENEPNLAEELLSVACRNLDTMHTYIHESLFFSEDLNPNFKRCELSTLLLKITNSMPEKLDAKRMTLRIEILEALWIDLDDALIQRVFTHLIFNAYDASNEGAEILLKAAPFQPANCENDWIRIEVIDLGIGISPENLVWISMAYFTTKTSGDVNRGIGLGLAICHKIINIHSGKMTLSNSTTKGVTVTIDLPDRQTHALQFV